MKHKQTAFIFVLMIVLSILLSNDFRTENRVIDTRSKNHRISADSDTDDKNNNQIKTVEYTTSGVRANYPEIVASGSEKERKIWNQLIHEDFLKIMKIYAFVPNQLLTPIPSGQEPVYLNITYDIKRNDKDYISILFKADFNSPYSAHPSELVYTTNIDKQGNRRVRLSDLINVNSDFVQDFRSWQFLPMNENNDELDKAIKDYVANISDKELLNGFLKADIIGSDNNWGIYSYLTNDSLGISLGAPHYIGDHIEFEMKLSELSRFLKKKARLS